MQRSTIEDSVPTPDIVYGSDFLRFLPKEIASRAYCVNGAVFAQAVAPIRESAILGPLIGCGADAKRDRRTRQRGCRSSLLRGERSILYNLANRGRLVEMAKHFARIRVDSCKA